MSGISIRGSARGSGEAAFATARRRGTKRPEFTRSYFDALYADASARGIDADVLVAQWDLETGAGTSAAWIKDGNPAGLAIFDDGSSLGLSFSPETAARAHVTHMARYLGMTDVPVDWIEMDARWDAVAEAGFVGTVKNTGDLGNGRWATDKEYGRKMRERYVAYWGEPAPEKEKKTVSTTRTINVPFRASIIPAGAANRPGFLLNTDDREIGITQHTTGNTNPGANAEMHRIFTHNGGGPERVSFHFTVDDTEIIQLLPLFEGAFHAADGCDNRATDIGCFDTVAIELCVNAGANWAKAKDNLAQLYAMLWTGDSRLVGIDRVTVVPGRVFTHQEVSDTNKFCPTQLLNEGSLPTIIAQGKKYAALENFADPIVYDWLEANEAAKGLNRAIGDTTVYYLPQTYTAIRQTPRLRQASDNAVIGPPIEEGESFKADYVFRHGKTTFVLTPFGTRVKAAHLLPKVQVSPRGTISIRQTKDSAPVLADPIFDSPHFSPESTSGHLAAHQAAETQHQLDMRP